LQTSVNPTVTVLIPVFNREVFVDKAIRSVVDQDYEDLEIVVVDDGSTDGTADVLALWAEHEPRVVVVTSASNQGIPAALNLGLSHARGKYIARQDSDDLMRPGRLAAQVALLETRGDVVLVSCAYDIVDAAGNYLGTWKSDEPHEVAVTLLGCFNVIGGGGQVMFRRTDVEAVGGFSLAYPAVEDYDLWVRLLRRGRLETLPLVGMTKCTHPGQTSKDIEAKRAMWTSIMRSSLEPRLQRPVTDEEIAALISVWRHDRRPGMAATADRIMRDVFQQFQRDVRDPGLQSRLRRRIRRQWLVAARHLARRGHPIEAMIYLRRAAGWLIPRRADATG
jgi:glycosyltransferase involved in cell wall biosynthesis